MADRSKNISIRLSLKDDETVRRALVALGDDGQKALARIEKQSAPASRGLLAFNAVTKEVRAGATAYAGSLGAVGAGMSALGPGGLAAAAGVAVVVLALKRGIEASRQATAGLDALNTKAEQLGVGVEALQEYRYAFAQVGVNAETLEMALQRLGRRVGEVANFGTGEAKPALQELGISVLDAAGKVKTLEELLPEVADGLAKVTDQNQRMSLAQKLFDSEGVKLVTLLQQGAEAFNRMRAEAREMGAVLDEHLVKQASETNRQLVAMQTIIDTQMKGALVSLSPLLLDLAKAWAAVAHWIGEVADNWRDVENRTSSGLQTRLDELNKALAGGRDIYVSSNARGSRIGQVNADRRYNELIAERDAIAAELARRKAGSERPAAAALAGYSQAVKDRIEDLELEKDGLRALAGANEMDEAAVRSVTAARKADAAIQQMKLDRDSQEAKVIAGLIMGNARLEHSITVLAKARAMDPERVYAERMRELAEIRKSGLADEKMIVREEEAAERKRLDAHTDAASGIKRSLMDLRAASRDTAEQWETDVKSMNSAARESFIDIGTRAKTLTEGLQGLLNALERTVLGRIYDRTVGSAVDSVLDAFFETTPSGIDAGGGPVQVGHTGGTIGALATSRLVRPFAFADAERRHGGGYGLRKGEVPIIALETERVLTAAQQDNTARSIENLARLASANMAGANVVVKPTVTIKAPGVTARTQTTWSGGELRVETVVEEMETRMSRNISRGEGLAPVIEQRYGVNPAAGTVR